MDTEELNRKRELLEALKRRKHERDVQAATLGVVADPVVNTERRDLEQQIEALEREIAQGGWSLVPQRQTSSPPSSRSSSLSTMTKIVLGLGLIGLIYLFVSRGNAGLNLASQQVNTSSRSTQASVPSSSASSNGALSLSIGQAWSWDGMDLTLESASFDNDTVTLSWRLTRNTVNSVILGDEDYKIVEASAINGVKPVTDISCLDFKCGRYPEIASGKTIHFTHTLRYLGVNVSEYTGVLIVKSGLTNKAEWSVVR